MVQYPRWVVIKGCSLIATDNLIITDNPCIYIAATSVCAGILFTSKEANMAKPRMIGMIKKPIKNTDRKKNPFEKKKKSK